MGRGLGGEGLIHRRKPSVRISSLGSIFIVVRARGTRGVEVSRSVCALKGQDYMFMWW